MIRTNSAASASGISGHPRQQDAPLEVGIGKVDVQEQATTFEGFRQFSAALEVSTNGVRVAAIVPNSGTVTAKSERTSRSSPSISISALSVSSISRTVGSVRRIAVSSGREQNSSLKTSSLVRSQSAPSPCPA